MRRLAAFAASLAGALLLAIPSRVYRIDVLGQRCAEWPSATTNLTLGSVYLLALALLTLGWLYADYSQRATALYAATAVHLAALLSPPFLSMDPLFYAAIGHVTVAGGDPYHTLASTIAGDPILALVPEGWRFGTSAYFPGFNQLARIITLVARGDIIVELRLFQALGAIAILGAANIVAGAIARRDGEAAAARALALIALCPLGVIEATVGAHNDALIAVAVALSVWLILRGRRWTALAAVALGLVIKASAVVVLVAELGAIVFRRWTTRQITVAAAILSLTAGLVLWQITVHFPELTTFTALVGGIDQGAPHVTHSWESLPRSFFFAVVHSPVAGFAVNLAFRAAGLWWLMWTGARAARNPDAALGWLATAVYGYYLFFHGYMESWYLLTLLPLVPFAPPRFSTAIRVYLVAQIAYYPISLWRMCDYSVWGWGTKEIGEGLIVTVLPTAIFYAAWRGKSDIR